MPFAPPPPRWDIVAEHLDEAEFLWGMWEHSLRSPLYTLASVASGPERRLRANIDGLVVNGPEVGPQLLVPALADASDERVCAAATALLAGPDSDGANQVLAAWAEHRHPALTRALACTARPGIDPLLRAGLDDPATIAAAADVLVARGQPLGTALAKLLHSDDPQIRAQAVRAVPGEANPTPYITAVCDGLTAPDLEVVDAAIASGTRLQLEPAWARARERAQDRSGSEALLLLALRGNPADHPLLLAWLARPRRRVAALWALSFVGLPEVVDACLEFVEDPAVSHLAGEVLTAVTGVDLVTTGLVQPDPDAPPVRLTHTPEDELPRGDPMAVLQWWLAHRGEFRDGQRYLHGRPFSLTVLREALRHGPMRRRPVYLQELQRHPPTAHAQHNPWAPTDRQLRELATLDAVPLA